MKNIFDVETAFAEVQKMFGKKLDCSEKDLSVCLGLLKDKHNLRRQIREIEKKIDEKQKEIMYSDMAVLHPLEYVALLAVVFDWGEKNDMDAL